MKRHVVELIEKKIENLCNAGHKTESFSVHIPTTQEQGGPSSHTIGQRRTRKPLSVDEVKTLVRTIEISFQGQKKLVSHCFSDSKSAT